MSEAPDDLISIGEVRKILDVNRQRADVLSRQVGFPEPAQQTAIARYWKRSDVEAYAANRKPTTTAEETP